MPRFHKRKPGSRRYLDFDDDQLKKAIDAINSGSSQRDAAKRFGIPRSTLARRLKGTGKPKKPGRPPVLTEDEEKIIVHKTQVMCDWGYPLDGLDLRYLVKQYLDRKGVNEKMFKNNLPSHEYVLHFLRRNPELTNRFANNIKRARAKVSKEVFL